MSSDNIYLECYREIIRGFFEIRDVVKSSKPYLEKIRSDSKNPTSFKRGDTQSTTINVIRNGYPRLIHNIMGAEGYIDAIDLIIKNVNKHYVTESNNNEYIKIIKGYSDLNVLTNNNRSVKNIFNLTDDAEIKSNINTLMTTSPKDKDKFIASIREVKNYFHSFCMFLIKNFLSERQKQDLNNELDTIKASVFRNKRHAKSKSNIYNTTQDTAQDTVQDSAQDTVQDSAQDTAQDTVQDSAQDTSLKSIEQTNQLEELDEQEINDYYDSVISLISLSHKLCQRYLKAVSPGEKSFYQDPSQFIRFYSDVENILEDKSKVKNVVKEFDFIIDIFSTLKDGLYNVIEENNFRSGSLMSEDIGTKFNEELDYVLNIKKDFDIQSIEELYESFHEITPQSLRMIFLKFKKKYNLNKLISYLANSIDTLKEYKSMFNVSEN